MRLPTSKRSLLWAEGTAILAIYDLYGRVCTTPLTRPNLILPLRIYPSYSPPLILPLRLRPLCFYPSDSASFHSPPPTPPQLHWRGGGEDGGAVRLCYFQCCGSGMFIPDPDFYPSRIPDPGSRIPDPKTATKDRGEKKLVSIPFYVATNFTKL
jgi:hypothetical protein